MSVTTSPKKQTPDIAETDAATVPAERGIAYLRVSTVEQATRGGRDEGFSIPAQREAVRKAAADAGVQIIEEFIDAGESATNARRPELRRMLAYIKDHRVDVCYVHKLDRLARNRADDVAINLALGQCGVRLVSVTENIDESASGVLVHGILASISEFYSRNLSTEVTKGLRQKAIAGGTISRAPLGYFNLRRRDENGREYRTVDVDPARAPLVAWAYEAYATGEWSLSDLCDELALRGLTSLPTPKRPSKPINTTTLHRMLRNPYYKGQIIYKGAVHLGTHDPLVKPLIWTLVQDKLNAHNLAGDRTQTHDHYLKGSLYCQCGAKMTVNLAKNKTGEVYPYFICLGRHKDPTSCDMQAILVSTVERLVEEHYRTIEISDEACQALEGMIGEIFAKIDAQSAAERATLKKQAEKLEDQQLKVLQSFYDDAITTPMLKREQHRIQDQLDQINQRLETFELGCKDAQLRIRALLAMATNSYDLYRSCDPTNKRLCNQAFFTKLVITENWQITHEFDGFYDTVLDPTNRLHADYWQRTGQLHPDIRVIGQNVCRIGACSVWSGGVLRGLLLAWSSEQALFS